MPGKFTINSISATSPKSAFAVKNETFEVYFGFLPAAKPTGHRTVRVVVVVVVVVVGGGLL